MNDLMPKILVVAGVLISCFCAQRLFLFVWLTYWGRSAIGVVSKTTEWVGRAGRGYTPTLRFKDTAGLEHEFRSRSSSEFPNDGLRVEIRYAPRWLGSAAEIAAELPALTKKYAGCIFLCVFMICGIIYSTRKNG